MTTTQLPRIGGDLFLADGGLETTLVFHEGLELPEFAAFTLLDDPRGRASLTRYYESYARIAADTGLGLALDTPTWRASADWAPRLGYDVDGIRRINEEGVALVTGLREDGVVPPDLPFVVNGVHGPRGDGYQPGVTMSVDEAAHYHALQARAFAAAGADLVTAVTMNYVEEAVGVAQAADAAGLPVAISFTVETDGGLPSGQPLGEAVEQVDRATSGYPAYYMVNCAHPSHFEHVLDPDAAWTERIGGIRANASAASHSELDEAEELDAGDPQDLARRYVDLKRRLPGLTLVGGCCGTDDRHIRAIAEACLADA